MSITTLVGLSFGVFPCLLFGFIMLLSLLICEYLEEYVAKHLCAWKNRRRRGLRSVYRDFRERSNSANNLSSQRHHFSSITGERSRTSRAANDGGDPGSANASGDDMDDLRLLPEQISPTAPPYPAHLQLEYGAGAGTQSGRAYYNNLSGYPMLEAIPANDPPPSYEECVLPRVRWQQQQSGTDGNGTVDKSSSKPNNKPSTSKKAPKD